MRQQFAGYYRPNREQFERLWRTADFAVDANVLLNLYRYSASTRADFLSLLKRLEQQLWLPNQAAREFHRNRPKVMADHAALFASMRKDLKVARARLESLYRDPEAATGHAVGELGDAWSRLDAYLEKQEQMAVRPTMSAEEDAILTSVTNLFEGRTGEPFAADREAEIYAGAEERYSSRVPPGFQDADKPEPERYGDLLMWHQILERARTKLRPIVLVTADEKEDWWLVIQGQTLGPLPALREEFQVAATADFWAYKPAQFMETLGAFLDTKPSDDSIEEVRELRKQRFEVAAAPSPQDPDIRDAQRRLAVGHGRRRLLRRQIERFEQRFVEERDPDRRKEIVDRIAELTSALAGLEVDRRALQEFISTRQQLDDASSRPTVIRARDIYPGMSSAQLSEYVRESLASDADEDELSKGGRDGG